MAALLCCRGPLKETFEGCNSRTEAQIICIIVLLESGYHSYHLQVLLGDKTELVVKAAQC